MPDERKKLSEQEIEQINRLIRETESVEEADYSRPGDDVIAAYLLGKANAKQRQVVREALLASVSFRAEIVALTTEIEALGSSSESSSEQAIDRREAVVAGKAEGAPGWLDRIVDLLRVPAWGYAAAAILLVAVASVTYLGRNTIPRQQLVLISQQVDSELLRRISPRSASQAEEVQYSQTDMEAALSVMRGMIDVVNDSFVVLPSPPSDFTGAGFRECEIQVEFGPSSKREFVAHLPGELDFQADSSQIWILALPSRSLYLAPLGSEKIKLNWDGQVGQELAAAVTWKTSKGFRAIVATPR